MKVEHLLGPVVHLEGKLVNKSQLIDALAARYDGNRKAAQQALESVLDTITREVAKGEKVAITGFGSFEKRVREARWVRNPQTGARIKAKKTAVPKFTAGQDLKNVVSGAKKLPKLVIAKAAAPTKKAAPAKAAAPAKKTTSKSTSTKKAAAKTLAKKSPAAKAPAKKAAAKKLASKAPAKKTAPAKTAAKTTTKKTAPTKKAAAKKAPAKRAPAKKTAKKAAKKS
jgi:DNA-binding protein HU-beta